MSVSRRVVLIFLLVLAVVGCDRGTQNKDPDAAEIITEDIERFWEAYDAGASAGDFQEIYFDQGTKGLEDFTENAIGDARDLAAEVRATSSFYESIKPETLDVAKLEPEIRETLNNLKQLYPEATFPDIYFVIGTMSAGGKAYDSGLVLGTEKLVRTQDTITTGLSDWKKITLWSSEKIPMMVAHELIHEQQTYTGSQDLLYQSLREGSADFIAELISGEPLAKAAHDFAKGKEEALWLEFQEVMHSDNFDNWLYNQGGEPGRPTDLGYWMGYKIAEAYYEQADDKTQAVADIIQTKDADAFLEASGYAEKFD